MTGNLDSSERERYQSYLNIHLKKGQQKLPVRQQVEALQKRGRSKWWQLLVNLAAILFFGYSFYYDITQLGDTLFIVLIVVFGINCGLLLYQKRQINDLIEYLEGRRKEK